MNITDGQVFRTTLHETASKETTFRLGNMIRMAEINYKNEKAYRSLTASFVANIYKRYPDSEFITVHAYVYDLPTIEAYAEGERPSEKELYSAKFSMTNS